ncbi:hypothetical protein D9M68_853720 [compost metagenome]
MQRINAQDVVEGERLELALRAVADQGHLARAGPCQRARRQRGCHGRAQRSGERQLADQQRLSRGDPRQRAERHHGRQAGLRIAGMPVHIFEAVELAVGGGHQLDHPGRGMAGHPRALVEFLPSKKVRQHIVQQAGKDLFRALQGYDLRDVGSGKQRRHLVLPELWNRNSGGWANQFLVTTIHTKR